MAQFVINEWLWSDLGGENGPAKQSESFAFLQQFASSPHQMVILQGSAFNRKAWSLCKTGSGVTRIGSVFVRLIWQNSDRCLLIHGADAAPFPAELETDVNQDDRYLVQTCLSAPGSTVVTTDGKLAEALARHGFPCISREELLRLASV